MKKVYFILTFAFFAFLMQESNAQTTIWSEDFPYADGTIVGPGSPAKWTRDVSGCNFGNGDHFEVRNNLMEGRDTDGEAIWYSETIDISAYSNVSISALLSEQGNQGNNDYIGIYYSLDGGTETAFDVNGYLINDFGTVTASQTGLNGNDLQLIVRLNNNNNSKRHRFDDIIVMEPIPGDFCSNAIAIGEVTDLAFSTTNATQSGQNPGCGGNTDPYDIWYAYTPSASGIAMFDLCGSTFDTRLAIWDACGGNVLDCNDDDGPACSGLQSSIEMEVTFGTTYYVQVGGYNANTGDGDLTIQVIPSPVNDDCANATPINEVTDLPFSTVAATQSGQNPGCGGNTDPYDIWYTYTPSASGIAMFDLCGSTFRTRLAIWDACGGNVLDCNVNNGPACSGQQSSIEMAVVAGTTYYVQVGGRNAIQGDGDISISLTPYPANNDCANAISIGEVTDLPFSTTTATQSGADPGCGGNQPPIDIWYTYTPTSDGVAYVETCGSTYDTRLAIWDGCGGNLLLCNDDDDYCSTGSVQSYLTGAVTAGTTYYIQLGGWNTDVGDGDITIGFIPFSSNDDCADAIAINEVTDFPFTTIGATAGGDNPGCGGNQDPIDIWFAYTATSSGIAQFDLCGSGFDTRLAIWDACGGSVLDCNDDDGPVCTGVNASIEMAVISGTTYYVQVGGYNSDIGNGDLTIQVIQYPVNDDCAYATPINEVADLPFSTVAATQSGAIPNCGGGTAPYDVWYAYTATANGLATFDLCGSNFNTRLAIWDACGGTALECNNNNGPACPGQQSSIEMMVASGSTYYVQVGGRQGNQGDGDLTISVLDIGGSDDCANAVAINEVTDYPFSTTYATVSGVNPGCGGGTDPVDLWFAYTATQTGLASFDLCGSGFDTRLAIWDACGGNVLDCNDDNGPACSGFQSSIEMEVTLGTTYYVQVGGYNSHTGDGDLTIFVTPGVQNALFFDGADDYVDCGTDASLNITGDITIEAWIYSTRPNQNNWRRIVEKDWATSYFLGSGDGSTTNAIAFCMDANGSTVNVLQTSDNVIAPNEWHHVAGTWDGSTLSIYVDGILEASMPWSNPADGSLNSTLIARYYGSGPYNFQGYMDEIRIWNVARTQAEIRTDMHRELQFPSSETNLVAYYKFNQTTGTLLPDKSSNSNNGTLINMDPPTDWIASSAPIPYYTLQDGNWSTDATWAAGQMAPVHDWSRVIIDHNIVQDQDQGLYSLLINSGASLQVNPGYGLEMFGDIINLAGTSGFVFKADATGMASLVHNTSGIDATFEEYLSEQQWHYVSSPISSATIETYFDIYLMQYDEPTDAWTYLVNPVTTPLNVGHGYAAWASNAITGNTTVSYEGTLNTGDITYTSIDYTPASTNTGYNLIGNPFPSSIDWNTNWTTSNVDNTAYIYDGTQYVTWNRMTGTGTAPSGVIPPTQAFVILANGTSPSITFPQSERLNGNQPFYKDGSAIDNSLALKVSGNGYSDKIIVGFDYAATNNFDSEYDAYDFRGIDEAPQLYTMGDVDYAVNIMNVGSENLIIPVGLEVGTPGDYCIKVEDFEGFSSSSTITLEDVKENTFTELSLDEVLNFTVEMNDNAHRFNLHFKNGVAGIGNSSSSEIQIYSYDDMVYIQQPDNFTGEVSIFNMMGQEIIKERATGESLMSIRITDGMGYYVVKIQNGEMMKTKKVFIK